MPACPQEFVTPSASMMPVLHPRESDKHKLATEVLRSTGKLRLSALGYSMLPTIWPGDVLDIQAIGCEQVRAGDVVLFQRGERFFIHRVLRNCPSPDGSGRPSLVTRGDSMPTEDAPVGAEQLLGRVSSVQRGTAEAAPVPPMSWTRRGLGLALAYSTRIRTLALWAHSRHGQGGRNSELTTPNMWVGS